MKLLFLSLTCLLVAHSAAPAQQTLLRDEGMHHLRIDGPREWASFPERPEASHLRYEIELSEVPDAVCLQLRQLDVKQTWRVLVNGKVAARLPIDENDMRVYFDLPADHWQAGRNELRVEQDPGRATVDDVRIGDIQLVAASSTAMLNTSRLIVQVRDTDSGGPLPTRITILDQHGSLQTVGIDPSASSHLAVRPGTVYSATGEAVLGVPAGRYQVFAGRGFEYSLDSQSVEVSEHEEITVRLNIRREVPTDGWVACDTHVHSLTHSGHGDATVQERMITLAGEGIELPVATDHNVHVDHHPFAEQMQVRQYFTPVMGNEVTTPVGHFNIWPVAAGAPVPQSRFQEWDPVFQQIFATPGVKAVILNHARDLHSGVRPFGPERFHAAVGQLFGDVRLQANAMEVINSGATQSDPLQLCHDWMALLNAGYQVTPVGSSDSHDVGRHFVGQGRTYIRAGDRDPSMIDVQQAAINFSQGQVMVSYGLLVHLTVHDRYGPGELARIAGDTITLEAKVLGPHWTQAERLQWFANGQLIREDAIEIEDSTASTGVHAIRRWTMPRPPHDVHLVAIATGPGINGSYWKTAKPYQPVTTEWTPQVMGCSGAVRVDADGDGRWQSARDYAHRLVPSPPSRLPETLQELAAYDRAVAVQAAYLGHLAGIDPLAETTQSAIQGAAEHVRDGFVQYVEGWKQSIVEGGRSVP